MNDKIEIVGVLDPQLQTPKSVDWIVQKGAKDVTYARRNAASVSSSNINWSCNPPSSNTFISPYVLLKLDMTFTFEGIPKAAAIAAGTFMGIHVTGAGDALKKSGGATISDVAAAPRCAPISSVVQNLSVSINGNNVNTNLESYVHELLRYNNNFNDRFIRQSEAPMAFDMSQRYKDLAGGVKSPLASYKDSPAGYVGRRGFLPYDWQLSGVPTALTQCTATYKYVFYEYLPVSPFMISGKPEWNGQALFGVNTMDVAIQFSDLRNAYSMDATYLNAEVEPASAFTVTASVTGNAVDSATLEFCYLSPNLTQAVSTRNSYAFSELVPYITQYQTIAVAGIAAARVTDEITMNAVQLRVVPEKLWIYVKKRRSLFTFLDSDSYCAISGIKVNWENQQSLLGGATQAQLYEVCVNNGIQDAYTVWKDYTGSVLCLEFGKDIALRPTLSPGTQGTFNMSLAVTVSNISTSTAAEWAGLSYATQNAADIQWDLYVVAQNPGIISIENNTMTKGTGVISENDVLNATEGHVYGEHSEHAEFSGEGGAQLGGAKMGGLGPGSIIRMGSKIARGLADVGENVAPFFGEGAPIGGKKPAKRGGQLVKGNGAKMGGKIMTKEDLRALALE
jgi:hypothetical protein